MKFYIELAIAAVLLLLIFDKPSELTELSNTLVGKSVLIIAVGCIAKMIGLAAGLMAALVMLILLHDGREGFKEGAETKGKTPSMLSTLKKDTEKVDKKNKDKEAFTSVSDIRMMEGMRNMESYSNTIAASKFQNGYTGNREPFNGFI